MNLLRKKKKKTIKVEFVWVTDLNVETITIVVDLQPIFWGVKILVELFF